MEFCFKVKLTGCWLRLSQSVYVQFACVCSCSFFLCSSLSLSFFAFKSKIIFRRSRHFNDLMFETFIYILCCESEFLVLHIANMWECVWRSFRLVFFLLMATCLFRCARSQTTPNGSRFVYLVHWIAFSFSTARQEADGNFVLLFGSGMSTFQIH